MALTKNQLVLRLARKGPIRARDLDTVHVPRVYLTRLCDRGELERVGHGLYRLPTPPESELHTLADVAKKTPNAIVCLLSALQVHGLTTEAPHEVWVMIDTHARAPSSKYPPLKIIRAQGQALSHGVEHRIVEGVEVKLTSPAKTVADCFRYRRHVGLEVAMAALRDYLRTPKKNVDALFEAAKMNRVFNVIRPYVEALV